MKKTGLIVLALAVIASQASYAPRSGPESEIRSILDSQVEAWNRGDFERFMEYYWDSREMTFQSGDQRLYGRETLLKRYQANYSGARRGELAFEDLKTVLLTDGIAYVLGRYRLEYPDTERDGLFTIILKRFPQGWRIIHDHSSSGSTQ